MAGMGKRLRPHTLVTPKPLLPIAGKPIVQRLVEDIVRVSHQKVEEIAFITGHFGEATEQQLIAVAEQLGARGTIHYQEQPLGTAHAILCAASALEGPITVAFADTLFRADFTMDTTVDGVLWVQKISDPRQFGVVIVNSEGIITDFAEKPAQFVSDLAMIGIYYFVDGARLKSELQYLVDKNIMNGGEYQLPDALRNMVAKGAKFAPGAVSDWMDCGNKDAVLSTNRNILENDYPKQPRKNLFQQASTIIEPCYIGDNVKLNHCVIGPFVSLGNDVVVDNCVISDSIVRHGSKITGAVFTHSMIGSFAEYINNVPSLDLGDYSKKGFA